MDRELSERNKKDYIQIIMQERPYLYREIKQLQTLTEEQLKLVAIIVMRLRKKARAEKENTKCGKCEKLNKAMAIYEGFKWGAGQGNSFKMGYDEKTKEILIPEEMLLYFIKMANPCQPDRRIRLIKEIPE